MTLWQHNRERQTTRNKIMLQLSPNNLAPTYVTKSEHAYDKTGFYEQCEAVATAGHLPCVMLKRLGDKMAGHRKRKKIDAEIRLSLISSRPMAARRSLNMWKHSRSSLQSTQHSDLITATFLKLHVQKAITSATNTVSASSRHNSM